MIVVQSCRARLDLGDQFAKSLGAALAVDLGETPNALRGARQAWALGAGLASDGSPRMTRGAAARPDEWTCVVQDDAILHPSFGPDLCARLYALAEADRQWQCAIALYYGAQSATGQRVVRRQLSLEGGVRDVSPFVPKLIGEYFATVAAIVPTVLVKPWLEFSRRPEWADSTRDDECWGSFLDKMGVTTLATVPCLADHDNTIPSAAGNAEHGPRFAAARFRNEVPSWYL